MGESVKIGAIKYPRRVWNEMQLDAAPDKEEQDQMRREWEEEIGRKLICERCGSPLEIDPHWRHDLQCSRLCGYWVFFLDREYAKTVIQNLRAREG